MPLLDTEAWGTGYAADRAFVAAEARLKATEIADSSLICNSKSVAEYVNDPAFDIKTYDSELWLMVIGGRNKDQAEDLICDFKKSKANSCEAKFYNSEIQRTSCSILKDSASTLGINYLDRDVATSIVFLLAIVSATGVAWLWWYRRPIYRVTSTHLRHIYLRLSKVLSAGAK